MVLQPLDLSINAIHEEKVIPLCKSYELNYLAVTYNIAFEQNATIRLHLKNKAERDELTGLLNRTAFNDLVDFYRDAIEPLAFLLIDVDNFKLLMIHKDMQWETLRLRRLLLCWRNVFQSNDFPVRYGGDEFAVNMTEITAEQKGVIERKLQYLNRVLQSAVDIHLHKQS